MANNESEQPDYEQLELPDHEQYGEWHWSHRRAYIFDELRRVGHHRLLNKTELASQFGVTRTQIYHDLDAIAEYIDENMDDRHEAEAVQVFQAAVKELLNEGEWKKAADVQAQFSEWLERRGQLDKEPEQHEVTWRDFINSDS
jgi:hypothetical protein